jgi:probable HAF family extracellular repeat protein
MKIRALGVLGALVLSLGGAGRAAAEYIVTDLGSLGGFFSSATAINNSGQVVGTADASDGSWHAFLYSGGKMIDLGNLGGAQAYANAINNSGQVVGTWMPSPGLYHGFLYSGGKMTDLGTFGGWRAEATGINDSGLIVGTRYNQDSSRHGFTYSGGKVTDLPTGDKTWSYAYAVNNAGQVAGEYAGTDSGWKGYVISKGKLTALYSDPSKYSVSASALNSWGQVPLMGAPGTTPYGINDSGQVVGSGTTSSGQQHAFLFQNGKMFDLNDLISPESHWDLIKAKGINNHGQIVGEGINPDGTRHAFMLTPVSEAPEPGSLTLLSVGALALGGWVWRKRRRASRRSQLVCGLAAAAFVLAAGPARAEYIVTSLGVLQPTGINDAGQIIGTYGIPFRDQASWSDSDHVHAFLYDHGKVTDLASVFRIGQEPIGIGPVAINNAGQVAGMRYTANGYEACSTATAR